MDETDTWRAANLVIQRHGNMAEFVACRRVDAMIQNGDPVGEAAWKRILAAIKDLRRNARKTGQTLQ